MSQPLKLPQLNQVTICGRLVADPHPLKAAGDREGSAFTVALNRSTGRDRETVTTFVNCVAWGDSATAANKYLGKGSAVLITGALAQHDRKREKGPAAKELQVSVAAIQFLSPKPEGSDTPADPTS